MNERIKLGLWRNDDRQSDTHPHLKAGKPVDIDGKQYWLSAYVNSPKDDEQLAQRVQKFLDQLSASNGTYPIIGMSLQEVEQQHGGPSPQRQQQEVDQFDDPF